MAAGWPGSQGTAASGPPAASGSDETLDVSAGQPLAFKSVAARACEVATGQQQAGRNGNECGEVVDNH